MQEDYIMNSVELDQQFIDEQSDSYMSDEEREYWIDLEESHEEEEEVEIEPCDDVLVDDLINLCFCQPTQVELEERRIAEEKIQEKAKRLEEVKRVKQNKLPPDNLYSKWTKEQVNKLANHFNRGIK